MTERRPERAARGGGPKPSSRRVAEKPAASIPEDLRDAYGEVVRFYAKEFRAVGRRVTIEGRRYRDDNGKQHINPLVGLRDKAADVFHKLLRDYPNLAAFENEDGEVAVVVDARAELEKLRAARRAEG